jgi:LPXTG-motif cell wall-anchored protein
MELMLALHADDVLLVLDVSEFLLLLGVAGLAVWLWLVYRKRKRAPRATVSRNPPRLYGSPRQPLWPFF